MSKIGIMSMQRVNNYGSFMQAYCLKKIIKDIFSEDAEFIDYIREPVVVNSNNIDILKYPTFYARLYVKYMGFKFTMLNKFIWLPRYLNIKKINHNQPDNLIIGSDEVFNCTQASKKVGFSRNLFGKGYEDSNIISYAASFGFTNIGRLKKYKIYDEVKSLMNNFSSISIRDTNSESIIKELTGKKPVKSLDPVLVENLEPFAKGRIEKKKYLILYSYALRINKEEAKCIMEYAKSKKLKIISLGSYQECADRNLIINPFRVLNFFKNAECIITDTFHGTIFAAKFHKKFITLVRNTNSEKLMDLLKTLKLEERRVNDFNTIDKSMEKKFDFTEFDSIIQQERKNTIKYLKENIKL